MDSSCGRTGQISPSRSGGGEVGVSGVGKSGLAGWERAQACTERERESSQLSARKNSNALEGESKG